MRTLISITTALIAAASAAALDPQPFYQLAQAQPRRNQAPDVIFVPTPQEVVAEMLRLANVGKGDVLYDLGSCDGRIPVTAPKKFGVRAVGIHIRRGRSREAHA